jgi:hypothetical protein
MIVCAEEMGIGCRTTKHKEKKEVLNVLNHVEF